MRRLRLDAVSDGEDRTIRFGFGLGAGLRSRAVVGLVGPLGAGKTRLAQGIARGAGYSGRVRSPSFALLHVYRGRCPIRHLDLYRLESLDAGTAGEWEEAFDEEGISVIEWADRIPGLLPVDAIEIEITPIGETRRRLVLTSPLPSRMIGDWRHR